MNKVRKQKKQKRGHIDYRLILVVLMIMIYGFLILYSVSPSDAMSQLSKIVIGLVLAFFVSVFDYHIYEKLSFGIYVVAFLLCMLVLFAGKAGNGSTRWLSIGRFQFQPSEFAKLALIIVLAAYIPRCGKHIDSFKAVLVSFILTGVLVLPVLKSNLSTAAIIATIWFVMMVIACKKLHSVLICTLFGIIGGLVGILSKGYRAGRVSVWLHPEKSSSDDAYQTIQGMYAIGSGGLTGKGLGQSIQKNLLPEKQNDMIFSILCEEMGFFGAILLIIMYLYLLWRLLKIAMNARDQFGSFIAIGVLAHMSIQIVLNIMVVTNMIPNTGVILPFVSSGGSAVIILFWEMGIVLSVSRQADGMVML